jgi:hypothetical protein
MVRGKRLPKIALADLVVLIAATALGLALLRATIASTGGGYLRHVNAPHSHWNGPLGYNAPFYLFFTVVNGVPQLLVACLTVVVLSLRRRRSSTIPLSHLPGYVLSLAAVSAASWTVLVHGSSLSVRHGFGSEDHLALWSIVVFALLPNAGYMVLGSWMTLAISGHWAPTRSWLDRIGCVLGASLVMLLVLESGRLVLESARLM